MDERGYITVAGRTTDMIIRGGENVYPREIEDELFRHDALAGAVVVGLPDDYYGEVVGAFVVVKEGHSVTPEQPPPPEPPARLRRRRRQLAKIGDVRIYPLVDGELALPGPSFYSGTTDEDWLHYREFLEPVDHQPVHLCSLGGYLLRWDEKAVVIDCGIGPIPTAPFRGGGFRSSSRTTRRTRPTPPSNGSGR